MKLLLHGALFSAILCVSAGVPSDKPPHFPDWWFERGVIGLESGEDGDVYADYLSPSDYSPILQGQLLHVASMAIEELDAKLAPIGGAGFDMSIFREAGKDPAYDTPALIGQLKFVSSKFYDRFEEIGYRPGTTGWNAGIVLDEGIDDHSLNYPWREDQTGENLNIALIGQAKHLFSWDLIGFVASSLEDSDGDWLPDWWENKIYGNIANDQYSDTDSDSHSLLREFIEGSDPTSSPYSGTISFVVHTPFE